MINGLISYEIRDQVAVITMERPPVNSLGYPLRAGITQAIDLANADGKVIAIVLTGSKRAFSGGADITEFNTPEATRDPRLTLVIQALEDSPKPVIAAIAGVCLGGGFELALGAHFRVVVADAKFGLPEVKLGLLPGAGGTQRLPRLIGLEPALNMIVSGQIIPAKSFFGTPLVHALIEDDLIDGAVAFAQSVVTKNQPFQRARDFKVTMPTAEAFLQFARNTVTANSKSFPAPRQCVEAVAASLKPFEEGLRIERTLFQSLMQTPESRALRHVFQAERAAAKVPDLAENIVLRTIQKVGVIGAGTMGGGIAMNFLNAGLPVVLVEMKQEALDRGMATIRKNYETSMKKGKFTSEEVEQRMRLITPTFDYADLADADLIVEAVFEDMGAKEAVFKKVDAFAKAGAILASNTSYLNIDRIANFTKRPRDVLGLHFFSPANVMRLLEVVRGAHTAPDVLATSLALAKKINKVVVVSGVCDGFIGNRMLARYSAAAQSLINAGALPQQIDGALQRFGLSMGPFRMSDLAGLDIGWATRKRKAAEAGIEMKSVVADKLCEVGRFGQKTGAGWYRYEDGNRNPIPDSVTEDLIVDYRASNGITPRNISDAEVIERCIFALVNEGARILEESIAARASDIDLVYLNGYGFPLQLGGPMLYADTLGLPNIVRSLSRFAAEPNADPSWQPSPLLLQLAKEGKRFN
jgi:3-hydroxyacyl-CoA dehydrogenase